MRRKCIADLLHLRSATRNNAHSMQGAPIAMPLPFPGVTLVQVLPAASAVDLARQLRGPEFEMYRARTASVRNTPGEQVVSANTRSIWPVSLKDSREDSAAYTAFLQAFGKDKLEAIVTRLETCSLMHGRVVGDVSVLQTAPAAQSTTPAQALHFDYFATDPRYPHNDVQPATALIALEDDTTIDLGIAARDDMWERFTLPIPVGYAVVFDGNVVHAGSSYSKPNLRLHMYLDLQDQARPFPNTTTYLDESCVSEVRRLA